MKTHYDAGQAYTGKPDGRTPLCLSDRPTLRYRVLPLTTDKAKVTCGRCRRIAKLDAPLTAQQETK